MNLFEYRVEYYDDIDEKAMVSYGYLIAENYSNAINILCSWYGETEIESIKIDYINDKSLITVATMAYSSDNRPAMMDIINEKNGI